MEFLLSDVLEVLYGGAGGGGKTVALLSGAGMFLDNSDYTALLLRRRLTYLELPHSLLSVAHKWWDGSKAKFCSHTNTFRFPSGAEVVFGYCENEGDEQRYRSAQFQYIAVDELTEWSQEPYDFLFSRLRRTICNNVPVRMRSASNPGGIGHSWVKERFISQPNNSDKVFISAKLWDNPMLDQNNYVKSLSKLGPIRRKQIQDGEWIEPEGCMFQPSWFLVVEEYPRGGPIVRSWDKASTEPTKGRDPDYTVGIKATLIDGNFIVLDAKRFRGTPQKNEAIIRQTAEADGVGVTIYMEQEPGSAGVNDIAHYVNILAGYPLHPAHNTGSKALRADPLCAFAEQGHVKLLRAHWNTEFLEEFALFPQGPHDDIVDATCQAFSKLTEHAPLGGDTVARFWPDPKTFDHRGSGFF